MSQYSSDAVPWQTVKLGDIVDTFSGGTPPRGSRGMFGGEIPWVKSSELNQRRIIATEESLSVEGFESSATRWVDPGTPLIALYGATAGVVGWLDIPACTNQAVLALSRRNLDLNHRWLYWTLKHRSSELIASVQGSGQLNLSKKIVEDQVLLLPPPNEQTHIAAVLDTVDEAIARTEAVIAKLRQVRAGLLHDLLTRGLDENGELRDPVKHPEQFKDSPLGRVPREWTVARFEELAAVVDPQPNHRAPSEIVNGEPYIGIGDFHSDGSLNFESCRRVSRSALAEQQARFRINQGDILFGKIGTIGFPHLLPLSSVAYALNANTVLIKPVDQSSYAYWLLKSELVESHVNAHIHSTSQPAFGIQKIRAMQVPLPTVSERLAIGNAMNSNEALVDIEQEVLDQLHSLKSGLMADLLTGRVRVPVGLPQP